MRGAESGRLLGRQALKHPQQGGERVAQLAPVDDHVDRALFKQELGALEPLRKLLPWSAR